MITLLAPVLFLIIILVAIHSWFGLRIIRRGIIFTDLAIGQIAAVGAAVSVSFFHSEYLYFFTLLFALMGALLISFAVSRLRYIEAFIGLLYVLGASSVMLVLAQNPEGSEHFSALLAADVLFTSTDAIIKSAVIYAGIGILLVWVLPRLNGLMYELLFFTLLAVTVTSSVQLAGVLVVFVLLIAPALIGLMQQHFSPYSVALIAGTFFGMSAIIASYFLDLPTGYAIVFFGALSAVIAVLMFDRKALKT
ncbi:MAG: metal ABC transporter permease [Sulfurimonadaceae bacterium]